MFGHWLTAAATISSGSQSRPKACGAHAYLSQPESTISHQKAGGIGSLVGSHAHKAWTVAAETHDFAFLPPKLFLIISMYHFPSTFLVLTDWLRYFKSSTHRQPSMTSLA